jgi:hypothetical protein
MGQCLLHCLLGTVQGNEDLFLHCGGFSKMKLVLHGLQFKCAEEIVYSDRSTGIIGGAVVVLES